MASTPACEYYQAPGPTTPELRNNHSLIFDDANSRLVVFGGMYEDDPSFTFSNVWVSSTGSTWTNWGNAPFTSAFHSAIYDPLRARMVVFGGGDASSSTNATNLLSLPGSGSGSWTTLTTSNTPSARSYHEAIYDPVCDRMIVFGGQIDGVGPTNELWSLQFSPESTAPAAVTDLEPSAVGTHSVTLRWTAPFDVCGATAYDVRYSTSMIDATNFASASQASGAPAPALAGTSQSLTVNSLANSTIYYFALKTRDASANWSDVSNIACARPGSPPALCGDSFTFDGDASPRAQEFALGRVWPNPSSGALSVQLMLPDDAPVSLELLDIAGRVLKSIPVGTLGSGTHTLVLDRAQLPPPSIYFLRVRHGDEVRTRSVFLTR